MLDIKVEEQKCFREDRVHADLMLVLTSIIINKLNANSSTLAAFTDFKKAFDCIYENLLFYKMLSYNIDGNFFKSIYSLYEQSQFFLSNLMIYSSMLMQEVVT